jgi:integrase
MAEARARELVASAEGGTVQRFITDADEYALFLRWKAERKQQVPVPELVERFICAKERKGVSRAHLEGLKFLRTFAQDVKGNIADVTAAEVETFIGAQLVGPRRWNNIRDTVVALWRYARAQMLLPAEKTSVELIEKRKVSVVVQTFTTAEMDAILSAASPRWLPCFVLGAFAGIRPEELAPKKHYKKPGLRWENILWTKKKIDVPASVAKTGRRRFPPLLPAAIAFLSPYRQLTGPIAPAKGSWHEEVERVAKASGIKWRPDALRHSFASYRLALVPDMAALALELGNSPAMIFTHYLDLKHRDEARKWFGIRPEKAPNVLSLTA